MTNPANKSTNKITNESIMHAKKEIPKWDEKQDQFVFYNLEYQKVFNDEITKSNFNGIFTSVVQAINKNENITIKMASLINDDSKIDDYNLSYDFSLSTLGEPQINIYLLLSKPSTSVENKTKAVSCNLYMIEFKNKLDLSNFKTVEIFLLYNGEKKSESTRSVVANILEN